MSAWLNHPEQWLYYVGAMALNDRALDFECLAYTVRLAQPSGTVAHHVGAVALNDRAFDFECPACTVRLAQPSGKVALLCRSGGSE